MKSTIGGGIMFSIKRWLAHAVAVAALMGPGVCALEVRLVGEKISFEARGASLQEVLEGLARAGVRVRVDPTIEARVDETVREQPVEPVLRKILEPFGYVLIWDVIEGPIGDYPKLAEVQVFPVGAPEKATKLHRPMENFDVARGPDGTAPAFVPDEVLIGFRPGTRRDEFEKLIRELGASVLECAKGLGVYRIRLPAGANVLDLVNQLNRHPLVARAEPNYVLDILAPVAVEKTMSAARETSPRIGASGRAAVAILDSGLLSVPALEGVVKAGLDAIVPDRALSDPVGHGTQMALIASGAIMPSGAGNLGVEALGVPLVAIRAFDDYGQTSSFTLMRAIEYALDKGARVINMSWGTTTTSEFLQAAIEKALMAGAVVVAAAGNEPTGQPVYPAAYPGVVAVSALDRDGTLWVHSNTGNFITFAAPGTAELPVGYRGAPGSYAGTSIASAYVARALALYFDQHPTATVQAAIAALKQSARDAGVPGRDTQYGFGIIDEAVVRRILDRAK